MSETPIHGENMFTLRYLLQERFADDPMVYVSGNMMMYYVRNDKRRHTSPDVFFVRGIPNTYRDAYFVWLEGKGPDVVFEISSASTRKTDTGRKYRLFQDTLRVSEYFLFDPYEEYLRPSLQGFRLRKGVYVPIRPTRGRLYSEELGLEMGRQGRILRLYDPETGQPLLNWKEQRDEAVVSLARATAELHRAEADVSEPRRRSSGPRKRSSGPRRRSSGPRRRSSGPKPRVSGWRSRCAEPNQLGSRPSVSKRVSVANWRSCAGGQGSGPEDALARVLSAWAKRRVPSRRGRWDPGR